MNGVIFRFHFEQEFEAKDSSLKRIPRCDRLENHKKRKDGFCGSNQFLEIPQTTQFMYLNI